MSHISDILTGAKTALAANASFTTADIYKRQPLLEDWDRTKINLWVWADKPQENEQPFALDFRVYPINVALKFVAYGRGNVPSATDDVMVNKGTYLDAILTAVKTNNPWGSNPIATVYAVDLAETDMEFEEKGLPYNEIDAREYGILVKFAYHTYEDSAVYLVTENQIFLVGS